MDLFSVASPSTAPAQLTAKYRPQRIADFVGLEKPRKLAGKVAANPPASTDGGSYLFLGEPGVGKTSLALAMVAEMPAELHHIPSQDCTLDTLRAVISSCHYVPKLGCKRHVILIDESDQMSPAAQMYLLSKMDATGAIPDTLIICTANDTDRLHERFLSRCVPVQFSTHGQAPDTATLLQTIWAAEAPASAAAPNFQRIVKEACSNVRASLMRLQTELLLAD